MRVRVAHGHLRASLAQRRRRPSPKRPRPQMATRANCETLLQPPPRWMQWGPVTSDVPMASSARAASPGCRAFASGRWRCTAVYARATHRTRSHRGARASRSAQAQPSWHPPHEPRAEVTAPAAGRSVARARRAHRRRPLVPAATSDQSRRGWSVSEAHGALRTSRNPKRQDRTAVSSAPWQAAFAFRVRSPQEPPQSTRRMT